MDLTPSNLELLKLTPLNVHSLFGYLIGRKTGNHDNAHKRVYEEDGVQILKLFLCKIREDSQLAPFIFFVFSGTALIISFGAEFLTGAIPCSLCMAQRYLHGMLLLSAGVGLAQKSSSFIRICQILLLISFGVAAVHCLIQFRLIEDFCIRPRKFLDIASFKGLLQQTSISCRGHVLRLFNLPIPLLNAFGSVSLFLVFLKRTPTPT